MSERKIRRDQLFGELVYEYGWTRPYALDLLGSSWVVKLTIPCDPGDEIESTQRDTFARFEAAKSSLLNDAEMAILKHYQDVVGEYRQRLGGLADKLAPVIGSVPELKAIVRPTGLIVQQTFDSGERVIGLLLWCSWDPSLGLAVKFINEHVADVGAQDIVL